MLYSLLDLRFYAFLTAISPPFSAMLMFTLDELFLIFYVKAFSYKCWLLSLKTFIYSAKNTGFYTDEYLGFADIEGSDDVRPPLLIVYSN